MSEEDEGWEDEGWIWLPPEERQALQEQTNAIFRALIDNVSLATGPVDDGMREFDEKFLDK